MKTVKENYKSEIIIKNSKFITLIYKVNNLEEIKEKLNNVKTLYPKATHYCYAYILENYQKSSDDGEPGGTAGLPMLNILIKEELINILVITVRYFGGIKLGTGGLVRAYTKSLQETLSISNVIEVIKGYLIEITTTYDNQKTLEYTLNNYKIVSKSFNNNITYKILIPEENINDLKNYNPKILENLYIEKKEH